MKDMTFELRKKLISSVGRNKAGGMLFSGGLDSAVLTSINPNIKAITITLESYGNDKAHAESLVRFLNIEHYHWKVSIDEAISSLPEVIKALKTFDPAIPNDLVVYFGLKKAAELNIDTVMTGDGSDELFGGYSFMQEIDDLEAYIKKISRQMKFSSNELGDFFNIKIKQPFVDKEVMDFALRIPAENKIRQEEGNLWGKWILRKAFENSLPPDIIWQDKRPLEFGSGMTKIREVISSKVCDKEFKEAKKSSPIKFWDKEHYYYYRIYKDVIGDIPKPKKGEKECPCCGAGMNPAAFHCKVCGCILNWKVFGTKNKGGWSVMSSQKAKAKSQKGMGKKAAPTCARKGKTKAISYRLKCPKTANGLSHFVMYGDIKEEKTLL